MSRYNTHVYNYLTEKVNLFEYTMWMSITDEAKSGPWRRKSLKGTKKGPLFLRKGTNPNNQGPNRSKEIFTDLIIFTLIKNLSTKSDQSSKIFWEGSRFHKIFTKFSSIFAKFYWFPRKGTTFPKKGPKRDQFFPKVP